MTRLQRDDDVLTLAKAGDKRAQTILLRDMQDTWYRFALANVDQTDLAMEATQETALRVLQNMHRFDEQSTFKTWSLGIALNVCRELKRHAARQKRWARLRLIGHRHQDNSQTDQLQQEEHADLLHRYIATLSDRQREVITLRYFEHCTTKQTAQIMNVSQGTVKATLSQAIAQLRSKWND
ncbi:MAG: RNA polymerase sigma factor [Phycisphaeraceae bacterium JB051]